MSSARLQADAVARDRRWIRCPSCLISFTRASQAARGGRPHRGTAAAPSSVTTNSPSMWRSKARGRRPGSCTSTLCARHSGGDEASGNPKASFRSLPEALTGLNWERPRERRFRFRRGRDQHTVRESAGTARTLHNPTSVNFFSRYASSHEPSLQCSIFLDSSIEVQRIYGCCFVPTYGTVLRAG